MKDVTLPYSKTLKTMLKKIFTADTGALKMDDTGRLAMERTVLQICIPWILDGQFPNSFMF